MEQGHSIVPVAIKVSREIHSGLLSDTFLSSKQQRVLLQ